MFRVEVARIRPYDRNPRRTDNPQYARIKASIRAGGMAQPLVVTRRPGESDYRVAAGGNTRLRILQELHEETGDTRFLYAPCLCRPWTGEADVLLAHLKENDLRGELSFLDKAQAVVEVKRLIAAENKTGEVTQAQLAEALKARGYGLGQGRISQLEYTVGTLLPLLPQALRAGLGRPQVERIRRLDRAARGLWTDWVRDDDYDGVFAALCRRYDAREWDIDNLRRALEAEIAERAGISIHAVSMDLDARLAGRILQSAPDGAADEQDTPAPKEEDVGTAVESDVTTTDEPEGSDLASGNMESAETAAQASDSRNDEGCQPERHSDAHRSEDLDFASQGSSIPERSQQPTSSVEHVTPEATAQTAAEAGLPGPTDLKSLRARSWALARRLGQRHGIGELIAPLGDNGLGFLLRDGPDAVLTEALDEDTLAQVSAVWWVLARPGYLCHPSVYVLGLRVGYAAYW